MTIDEQSRAAKRRHPRGVAVPIRLQQRDLDILLSLSEGRYLTVPAIEWLHFPGWRERYKVYLEQCKTDSSATFYPKSDVYRRLVALRSGDNPLIYRLVRVAEQASQVFNRLPDAYVLAEAGAELLCVQRDYELGSLWYKDPRKHSIKNFEHSVAISTFYAALRCSLEFSGQQLTGWRADHLLVRRDPLTGGPGYDRVAVPGGRKDLAILPDATFTLGDQRYFVEIDRGTTNLASWAEKVRGYEVYRRSSKLAARYQTDSFTVLGVAPAPNRLQRIAEEVIKVTRQPGTAYRFITQDRIERPPSVQVGRRSPASSGAAARSSTACLTSPASYGLPRIRSGRTPKHKFHPNLRSVNRTGEGRQRICVFPLPFSVPSMTLTASNTCSTTPSNDASNQ